MDNERQCIQLTDGDGVFNFDRVNDFLKAVDFGKHGNSYRVVSIIGPQSSDACVEPANRDTSAISWDPSKVEMKLRRDINEQILDQLADRYEKLLNVALGEPVGKLLETADDDTWLKIRDLLGRETAVKGEGLSRDLSGLSGFDIDQESKGKMLERLAAFGRSVVETTARDYAGKAIIHMKSKFFKSFETAWDCTTQDDIGTIAKAAYSESLELLSVIAAIRLDDQPDNIKNTLLHALTLDGDSRFTSGSSTPLIDLLASSSWEGVPATNVLITPVHCKSLWTQLKEETRPFIDQAYAVQEKAEKLSAAEAKAAEAARSAEKAQSDAEEKAKEAMDAVAKVEKADRELMECKWEDKLKYGAKIAVVMLSCVAVIADVTGTAALALAAIVLGKAVQTTTAMVTATAERELKEWKWKDTLINSAIMVVQISFGAAVIAMAAGMPIVAPIAIAAGMTIAAVLVIAAVAAPMVWAAVRAVWAAVRTTAAVVAAIPGMLTVRAARAFLNRIRLKRKTKELL